MLGKFLRWIVDLTLEPLCRSFSKHLIIHILSNIIRSKENAIGTPIFSLRDVNYWVCSFTASNNKRYELLIESETGRYYIIMKYLVVYSDEVKLENMKPEELARMCLSAFAMRRELYTALEYAVLGQWKQIDSYIHEHWLRILEEIPDEYFRDYV